MKLYKIGGNIIQRKPLTRKVLPFIATTTLAIGAAGCNCPNKGPEYCNKSEAITEMKSRAERGSINPIIYDKGVMYINNNGDIVNLKATCCYKRMLEALYRGVNDIFRGRPIPDEAHTTGTDFKLAVYKYMPEIDPGGDKYMQLEEMDAMHKLDLMCERYSTPNSDGGAIITNNEMKTMMEEWAYLAYRTEFIEN